MKEQWLKDIQGRLLDFEVEAPAGLWEAVQAGAAATAGAEAAAGAEANAGAQATSGAGAEANAGTKASTPKPKPTPKSALQMWTVGVATTATVAAGAVAGVHYIGKDKVDSEKVVVVDESELLAEEISEDTFVVTPEMFEETQPAEEAKAIEETKPAAELQSIEETQPVEVFPAVEEVSQAEEPAVETPVPAETIEPAANEAPAQALNEAPAQSPAPSVAKHEPATFVPAAIKTPGKVVIDIFANSSPGILQTDQTITTLTDAEELSSPTIQRYYMPLNVGFNVGYRFNSKWSISAGLSYSMLSYEEDGYNSTTNQKLHYVGVPINFRYDILPGEHASLYAIAGVNLSQCVYGMTTQTQRLGKGVNETVKSTITSKPFQTSARVAIGTQINFTDYCGIFIEPGVSYHYEVNPPAKTFYQERPFNFNMNVGFRFSLGL